MSYKGQQQRATIHSVIPFLNPMILQVGETEVIRDEEKHSLGFVGSDTLWQGDNVDIA